MVTDVSDFLRCSDSIRLEGGERDGERRNVWHSRKGKINGATLRLFAQKGGRNCQEFIFLSFSGEASEGRGAAFCHTHSRTHLRLPYFIPSISIWEWKKNSKIFPNRREMDSWKKNISSSHESKNRLFVELEGKQKSLDLFLQDTLLFHIATTTAAAAAFGKAWGGGGVFKKPSLSLHSFFSPPPFQEGGRR